MPVSLKAREAQRGLDAERDAIVRQLNAARDAGDRDREEELLDELANIDFDETREEPTTLTEEQEQERREASGINDGIDARSIPRANVRDTFNPSGWYRPRMDRVRRPHPRRVLLPEASLRRFRLRRPRSRRLAGSRNSSKDPPPSGEPDLARRLYGAARCWLDATGIWPWSGWKRLAAEARAEREREWMRLAAREAGFVHVSELIEDELDRLGSLR